MVEIVICGFRSKVAIYSQFQNRKTKKGLSVTNNSEGAGRGAYMKKAGAGVQKIEYFSRTQKTQRTDAAEDTRLPSRAVWCTGLCRIS